MSNKTFDEWWATEGARAYCETHEARARLAWDAAIRINGLLRVANTERRDAQPAHPKPGIAEELHQEPGTKWPSTTTPGGEAKA